VIIIKHKDGTETRLEVPDNATVRIGEGGKSVTVTVDGATAPAESGKKGTAASTGDAAAGASTPLADPSRPAHEDEAWMRHVASLDPARQVEAVVAELRRRNPKYDGQHTAELVRDFVAELAFPAYAVQDISPVAALKWLKRLRSRADGERHRQIEDLTPLRNLPL